VFVDDFRGQSCRTVAISFRPVRAGHDPAEYRGRVLFFPPITSGKPTFDRARLVNLAQIQPVVVHQLAQHGVILKDSIQGFGGRFDERA